MTIKNPSIKFPLALLVFALLFYFLVSFNKSRPVVGFKNFFLALIGGSAQEVINHGPRTSKVIALTFDADMTPHMLAELNGHQISSWYDEKITKELEADNVPATIFITGLWAQNYPEAVREFTRNPLFEIGNHTFDHYAFKLPCYGLPGVIDKKNEITKTSLLLSGMTGKPIKLFRFPGGCYSQSDVDLVSSLGLQTVGWDVVSGDSFYNKNQPIHDKVIKKAINGSIIVMHISGGFRGHLTSLVLPSIIKDLRSEGFTFVTVSQLLGQ